MLVRVLNRTSKSADDFTINIANDPRIASDASALADLVFDLVEVNEEVKSEVDVLTTYSVWMLLRKSLRSNRLAIVKLAEVSVIHKVPTQQYISNSGKLINAVGAVALVKRRLDKGDGSISQDTEWLRDAIDTLLEDLEKLVDDLASTLGVNIEQRRTDDS
jgi:hypothetical protein